MRTTLSILILLSILALKCTDKTNSTMEDSTIVRIETSMGVIDIILFDDTPLHRDNFLKLIRDGFYDDVLFHRVIDNFMIQAGDPNSKNAQQNTNLGSGGPGYTIPAEFHDHLFHRKGALAAARLGDNVNPDKESSGSQFYIVHGTVFENYQLDEMETRINNQLKQQFAGQLFEDIEREYINNNIEPDYQVISERVHKTVEEHFTENNLFRYTNEQREYYTTEGGTPHLDGSYTVFGQTIAGFEIIDKIAAVETGPANRPVKDVIIKRITIID